MTRIVTGLGLAATLMGCVAGSSSSTTPTATTSPTSTSAFLGYTTLNLEIEGTPSQWDMFATSGWEMGASEDNAAIIVVQVDPVGLPLFQFSLHLDDPDAVAARWLAEDDLVDLPMGIVFTQNDEAFKGYGRIGGQGMEECLGTMRLVEALGPNPLLEGLTAYHYAVEFACEDVAWESLEVSGVYSTISGDFEALVSVIES